MSGFQTHMLIGGVGGLALTRFAPTVALGAMAQTGQARTTIEVAIIIGSALLATWPDIDEPGSFIGRRVQAVVTLLCVGLGGMIGLGSAARIGMQVLTAGAIGLLLGAVLGSLAGRLLLRSIRTAAGGHRRGTHSLLIGGVLVGAGAVLWASGAWLVALIPLALTWGQILHVLGDVVTPAGVPLLHPISDRAVRILPESLCRAGETLIALTAVLVGWILVRG